MQVAQISSVTDVYQASKWRMTVTNNVTGQQIALAVPLADKSETIVYATSGANTAATLAAVKAALDASTLVTGAYSTAGGVTETDLTQLSALGPFKPYIVGQLTGGLALSLVENVSAYRTIRRYTLTSSRPCAAAVNDIYLSRYGAENSRRPAAYKVVSADSTGNTLTIDDLTGQKRPSCGIAAHYIPDGVIIKRNELDSGWPFDESFEFEWARKFLNDMKTGKSRTVTDSAFTVNWLDRHINLVSTTSTGNYAAVFDTTVGLDGQRVTLVLPAALGGTDAFVTAGLVTAANATINKTLDAAGDRIEAVYSAGATPRWYILVDSVA